VVKDNPTDYIVETIDNAPPGNRVPDLADLVGLSEGAFMAIRKRVPEIRNAVKRYQARYPLPRTRPSTPDAKAERDAAARERDALYRIPFKGDETLLEKLERIEALPARGMGVSVIAGEALGRVAGEALDEIAKLRAQVVDLNRQVYKAKYALALRVSRQSTQRPGGSNDTKQGLSDEYAIGFD
jgi:hypothetical protein